MSDRPVSGHNPIVLAYIGDAVFEVYVREQSILRYTDATGGITVSVNSLHRFSTKYVKASAQALMLHRIADSLTPEESDIVRRGRNAKPTSAPRKADVGDYRHATGFEALIGYLYLKGDRERLGCIMDAAFISLSKDDNEVEK